MIPSRGHAGRLGCNKLSSKARCLKIKLIGAIQLITLLSFYFHTSVQANEGMRMSETHENCHKAMRDRHHYNPFHFPKHLTCETIHITWEGAYFEKTVFVPPNKLIHTCTWHPPAWDHPSENTSVKALPPDCQALSSGSRYRKIPEYPIIPINDDIYLHPEQTLSELITYGLYNGGNLVQMFLHGMIYKKIWENYQLSGGGFASIPIMLSTAWNSLAVYKHGLHTTNIHRDREFSAGETAFEVISTFIELNFKLPYVLQVLIHWPSVTFRDGNHAMKELAFFGLICLNTYVTINSWAPYFSGDHDHVHCPALASAPENARCTKQTEEMHILLDQ
ncbi:MULTISPECIES: hypothetical protein [unclassified Endozoicomonas]|uniref:hypothetical protein n=2 Tax=Endozoicomonas TaxID=305899 RepID=UPI002147383D|nr:MULTISPECIES: hypothetical protein [unclassified Endozoicomonas]